VKVSKPVLIQAINNKKIEQALEKIFFLSLFFFLECSLIITFVRYCSRSFIHSHVVQKKKKNQKNQKKN